MQPNPRTEHATILDPTVFGQENPSTSLRTPVRSLSATVATSLAEEFLLRRVVEGRERQLGEGHGLTLEAIFDLAELLATKGDELEVGSERDFGE